MKHAIRDSKGRFVKAEKKPIYISDLVEGQLVKYRSLIYSVQKNFEGYAKEQKAKRLKEKRMQIIWISLAFILGTIFFMLISKK